MVDVSVIIPTHNSIKYIDECITSVRKQSLYSIEIIIIDSSTDGTYAFLEQQGSADRRISVIRDDNSSYGHKMNTGIQLAKGNYVAFVESDDYIDWDMMKMLFETAKEHDFPDVVKADYEGFYDTNSERLFYPVHRTDKENYARRISLEEEPGLRMCIEYNIWAGIYKRDFIAENEIVFHESPGASFQDIGFSNQIALMAETAVFIKDCLYKYRMDNEGSSVKSDEKYSLVSAEYEFLYDVLNSNTNICLDEMAKAFLKIKKIESYEWNLNRLSPNYRKIFLNSIKNEDLSVTGYELLNYPKDMLAKKISLLQGGEAYDDYVMSEIRIKDTYKLLEQLFGEEEIIIFGAGKRCEAIICFYLMGNYKTELYLCDNQKKGSTITVGHNSYVVSSVEQIYSRKNDVKILISSYANREEMINQLKQEGACSAQIRVCEEIPSGTALFESYSRYKRGCYGK